ncbi:MAG: hypothetical protein K0S32_237 [Bacteroidetes bacterium]|jgi:hypothetical protein|nr:hypothetical protein [Bacteroidota bacterium]
MIAVKRNSDEFKAIRKLISSYKNKPARMRSILLYNLKPYHSLKDVVELNSQKKNALVLYDLAYNSLEEYFDLPSKKLFRDEDEDIYYFKSSARSRWMELPFNFKGKLKTDLKKLRPVKLKIV